MDKYGICLDDREWYYGGSIHPLHSEDASYWLKYWTWQDARNDEVMLIKVMVF